MKLLGSLLVLALTSSSAFAADPIHLGKRLGLGFGGGVPIPIAFDIFKNQVDTGWSVEGHADYYLSDAFGLELQYQHLNYKTGKPLNNAYTLGFNTRLAPTSRFSPVVGLAAGWGLSTVLNGLDAETSNFVANGKVGFDIAIGDNVILEAAAKYYWLFSKNDGRRDQQSIIPSVSFTYFFGHSAEGTSMAYPEATPAPSMTPAAPATPVDGDDDADGVLNSKDKCPNTPAGAKVNSLGCQVEEKVSQTVEIEFATGKSTLPVAYFGEVDKMVDLLKEHTDLKAEIQGYTDNKGGKAKNLKLSQMRAASVRNYIVKHGIEATRVSAKGYGEADPTADNSTAEGRKQNRRVVASIQSK